jgi:hypothetical protein
MMLNTYLLAELNTIRMMRPSKFLDIQEIDG